MIKYYVTNSFSIDGEGGNPAGVVYLRNKKLDDKKMQEIAKELNFSETAFINDNNQDDSDFIIKFFTPIEEVDLCGHATLASFYIISELNQLCKLNKKKITYKQKTIAGILNVELKYTNNKLNKIVMEQGTPEFIKIIEDYDMITKIFSIDRSTIGYANTELKPMICSTGLKDIILPLDSVKTLRNMRIDFDLLRGYSKELGVVGIHGFTFLDKENKIVECRNFAPAVGINEESATGTSNGALGGYLVKNEIYTEGKIDIKCIQGVTMNKTSEINVVVENSDIMGVKVGGSVTLIDEGYIKL